MQRPKSFTVRHIAIIALACASTMGLPTSMAVQAQSSVATEVPKGNWPEHTVIPGEKWTTMRMAEGCYLWPNDFAFETGIALAVGESTTLGDIESIIFADPRLIPLKSGELLNDPVITLNGKTLHAMATLVTEAGGLGMAVVLYYPTTETRFNGKPVQATFSYKGLNLSGTIDPAAQDLAIWRQCVAGMRGAK